jgi:hypothetical protein
MSRAQLTSTVEQNTGGAVAPFVAGKNAIINGGFDIWQRGTSFVTSGITYTADRWQLSATAVAANCTATQTAGSNGAKYAVQFGRQSGVSTQPTPVFATTLETSESLRFAGQNVTISFEALAGANYSGGALSVYLYQGTGTDQNFTAFTGGTNQTATKTISTTNTRYTVTFAVPSGTTQLALGFLYATTGTAGAADYVQIQKVQLELGSVATPFSRAGGTLQGELAACQRYYAKVSGASTNTYPVLGNGNALSSTGARIYIKYPQSLRTIPVSIDFSSLAVSDAVTTTSVTSAIITSLLGGTEYGAVDVGVASGLTQYRPYALLGNGSSSGYVAFNAEL